MMVVERIQQGGHVFYRLHSEYAKDTLAFEPDELLSLLEWLKNRESIITHDVTLNRLQSAQESKGEYH